MLFDVRSPEDDLSYTLNMSEEYWIVCFALLTQYCAGDKIEKNEMGWACGAYG